MMMTMQYSAVAVSSSSSSSSSSSVSSCCSCRAAVDGKKSFVVVGAGNYFAPGKKKKTSSSSSSFLRGSGGCSSSSTSSALRTPRAVGRGGGSAFETNERRAKLNARCNNNKNNNDNNNTKRGVALTATSSSASMMSSSSSSSSNKKGNSSSGKKGKDDASASSSSSLKNNGKNKNKNSSDDECETTPANAKWKRVMLKISGEALSGTSDGQNFGLDPSVVERIAGEIVAASMSGVEIAVVVGGGNFFRGASHEGAHLDRASADYMGMLATVMNAISLQGAIEAKGVQTRVLSALSIKEVAEPYIRRRAMRHLEKGRVVIFGAGTGNPFFTTDTGAALRAAEINAQVVLKATKVDGVFCSDPKQNVNAKKYERLSYETVQRLGLGVMDQTAITMCRENDLPIVVFDMTKGGNIQKAIRGQPGVGTCISDSDEKCP
jgi:uridylate kinase